MALRWDVRNVEDHEEVCYINTGDGFRINPVTQGLICLSMAVGLGEITDENVGEWAARIGIIEAFDGPMVRDGDGEPVSLARESTLRAHVGLRVNVSKLSRDEWFEEQVEPRMDDVVSAVNEEDT